MITSPGRGRIGKKAVDENNQELPPPRVGSFKQEGYYSEPGRIAKLPVRLQINIIFLYIYILNLLFLFSLHIIGIDKIRQ